MRKRGINVICLDILNKPQVDVVHDLINLFHANQMGLNRLYV
jgi:hypothetical protein